MTYPHLPKSWFNWKFLKQFLCLCASHVPVNNYDCIRCTLGGCWFIHKSRYFITREWQHENEAGFKKIRFTFKESYRIPKNICNRFANAIWIKCVSTYAMNYSWRSLRKETTLSKTWNWERRKNVNKVKFSKMALSLVPTEYFSLFNFFGIIFLEK